MNKLIWNLLILISLFACKEKKNQPVFVEGSEVHSVKVGITDTSFIQVDGLLETEKYVILSPAIPLGEIKRVIVDNERIYILDNEPKIVCFDFSGKAVYLIASKGSGPREYSTIVDFAINPVKNQLTLYDSGKRKLRNYNLLSGKYISDIDLKIAPMGMAIINDVIYFDNPDSYNYPNSKEFHYFLLSSFSGEGIDAKFFPHDGIVSEYNFLGSNEHPFYYNGDLLYYNKMFDDVVYKLDAGKVEPIYQIELPDPVPMDLIKQQIEPIDLIEGPYSSCLEDLYECDSVLYFTFTYKKSWIQAFYDLKNGETIYCGPRIFNDPTKDLLAYYPIRGKYKDCFYSIVPPEAIQEKIEMDSTFFPDDLKKLTFEDNPVIMFYKVNK